MTFFAVIASVCPLLMASMGALVTEYAGVLALFIEGLISCSAFIFYFFTVTTGNVFTGAILTCLISIISVWFFAFLVEKFKAHCFIAGIGLNLLYSAIPAFLSFVCLGQRGVLTSSNFLFQITNVRLFSLIITVICVTAAVLILLLTRPGLYIRITGSDADVLTAKGISPGFYRICSWCVAALFCSFSGIFLALRINSYVPNIASGRGWMALAAVFLGKKKPWRIIAAVMIFCCADFFASNIQNYLPSIPNPVILSFPYLIAFLLIFFN